MNVSSYRTPERTPDVAPGTRSHPTPQTPASQPPTPPSMAPMHSQILVSLVTWCLWAALPFEAPTAQAFVAPPHRPLCPATTLRSQLFATSGSPTQLSHSDIEWRLRPPEGTSRLDRWKIKIGANLLRLDSKLKGRELPPVLCPRGGRALLEAYYKGVWVVNLTNLHSTSNLDFIIWFQNPVVERRKLLVLGSQLRGVPRLQKVSSEFTCQLFESN